MGWSDHESLTCDQYFTWDTLENVKYITRDDGASSRDLKKYSKNIKMLKEALMEDPKNERNIFIWPKVISVRRKKALPWNGTKNGSKWEDGRRDLLVDVPDWSHFQHMGFLPMS